MEKFNIIEHYYQGDVETKLNEVFKFFEALVKPMKKEFSYVFDDVEIFTEDGQDAFGLRTQNGQDSDSWTLSEKFHTGCLTYQCTLKKDVVRTTKAGLWNLK